MKTAIILHGMPSKEEYCDGDRQSQSNSHWLPWLQQRLIVNGILAQTPELPEPYAPDYENWREVFDRFPIDEETVLVGHSCGAGFIVRWLSENEVKVDTVALVAPYLDPDGDEVASDFFKKLIIDPNLANKAERMAIFYAKDDEHEILASVKQITDAASGIDIHEFEQGGHFTYGDMGTREFPELLTYIVKTASA